MRVSEAISNEPTSPAPRSNTFPDEAEHEDEHEDEADGQDDADDQDDNDPLPFPPPSPNTRDMATFSTMFARAFAQSMTGVIETISTKLGKQDSGSSKGRIRDPDVFDGSDPRKLQSFFVSLSLVFADRPSYYTETRKISYTLSYLGGTAREYFEPDILNPDPNNAPAWVYRFEDLVAELSKNFGVYDAEGEAEDKLGNLRMKETDTALKYMTKFANLAASSNWDQSALQWAFRRGLAIRLKDDLAHNPHTPETLAELRSEVLRLDNRYWRREE